MSCAHFLQQTEIRDTTIFQPDRPQFRQCPSTPDRLQNGISSPIATKTSFMYYPRLHNNTFQWSPLLLNRKALRFSSKAILLQTHYDHWRITRYYCTNNESIQAIIYYFIIIPTSVGPYEHECVGYTHVSGQV